ncbi:Alpha/Beta hydrolase protein [Aspergillus similis]
MKVYSPFPEPHMIPPQPGHPHTHTAILLHGRASSGPEFAEDLFSSYLSHGTNLVTAFPTWRWVFPTSRVRWSSMFQEEMCAWFEAGPLSAGNNELEAEVGFEKKERRVKMEGLRRSVGFIVRLVEREVKLLEDKEGQVFLGGISQGMATGLCALFCLPAPLGGRLGGFLGMCGWLPFAGEIAASGRGLEDGQDRDRVVLEFFSERIFGGSGLNEVDTAVLSTPLLLMHGTDDVWVPVELGRQARRVVEETMGMSVEWLEFIAAENDGHWIKEPDGFDEIAQFFARRTNYRCKRPEA